MRHEVSGDLGFFLQYCDYLVSKIQHNQVSSKRFYEAWDQLMISFSSGFCLFVFFSVFLISKLSF